MNDPIHAPKSGADRGTFPPGGGEMGRLIREFNWARTALGPITAWRPALCTATNIVLQSPLPLVMLWGPDGIMIYNDAYSVFAGGRHPRLLGSKVLEGWAEVADFNRRVLDVGLGGGTLSFKDQELTLYRNNVPEQVFMDLNYGPVLGDDNQPAGVLAIVIETTARVEAERALAAQMVATQVANQRLSALISATADIIYEMSADWREMRTLQGRGFLSDTDAPSVAWLDEYIFADDQAHVLEAIEDAVKHQKTFQLEHRVRRADGSVGWTFSRAVPLRNEAGNITQWFGAASDVTARKEAEEHLRLVINELNHRVKNTLAMVQAVAAQTFRGEDHTLTENEKFTARVKALAQATDLMTGHKWVEASLRTVVASVVGVHCDASSGRCDISGPDMRLEPKTGISLSMALHELGTNAIKYGAWSNDAGKVSIRWEIEGNGSDAQLKLEWRESGGPSVSPPSRRGFGSRLIERGLAAEMEGRAVMRFEPGGLVCVIEAPLAGEART
jgi:two-component sensor histidine kinase